MSIIYDTAAIGTRLVELSEPKPVKYTTFVTYGNRENISDMMVDLMKKELGGISQQQVDAFNAAIQKVDRASFGNGQEADYQYMLALFRMGRTLLSAPEYETAS